ncbi:hypothetical protein [Mycobacterium sp.]|uniref:NACHT domain-containing protein n=1 Tax=Mycobacterium sp. TaxID=1785 RepID=UPI002C9B8E31|nr:hypothetical protein [Mycobacterium sp.]HKP39469.1 hypothetical protein [Mycobacterium sp.]
MDYHISMINGLRLGSLHPSNTIAARILSGLLAKPNAVVDGDSLVEAGWWSDDPYTGRPDMVRTHKASIVKLLDDSGVPGWDLTAKNAGAYELTIDPNFIDIHDLSRRLSTAISLVEQEDILEAIRELEPTIKLLTEPISTIGHIEPVQDSVWMEELSELRAARIAVLELYFKHVFSATNHDPAQLLKTLNAVNLTSTPSEILWWIRVGLTAEVEGEQRAARTLSDAKIALTRLSVPNTLDSSDVSRIHDSVSRTLKERYSRPEYEPPAESTTLSAPAEDSSNARWSAIRSDLSAECERLLMRKITGSSILTLRDMSTDSALRMPARATIRSGANRRHSIEDILTHLTHKLRTSDQQYMIIAPPGAGKSLICRLIFLSLAEQSMKDGRAVPGLIDLRSMGLSSAGAIAADRDILLLDSLDELLASGTLNRVREAVEDQLIATASVIACRTQFYEQFLTGSTLIEGRQVIEIRAWDTDTIEAYIDAYHQHVFQTDDLEVVKDLKRRLESPSVQSLLSIPLRLNMALDLIPPGENNLPVDLNSLSLHRQWIQTTLRNESARRGSILEPDEKLQYLTTLAWRFYDEGTPGTETAPSFTESDIRQVIAEIMFGADADEVRAAVRDIELYSILVSADPDGGGTTLFDSFEFQHKTYQEFLVARYIMNAVLSGPEAAASVFRQYLSPQVSDFIKDDFKNASRSAGTASRLATNMQQALATYDRESARDMDSVRLRSTTQQICYYLASLPLAPIRESMLDRLAAERDPWIARAIAIGLSFGGETRGLDQYIESLRRERQLGRSTDANDLNIGFHLSFFGDQPFDPVQPYLDRGLESVTSTVSRLIYQLSIETDFGSWRLDLYTVLDLYQHRPQSRVSCVGAIVENRDRLNWVLRQFRADPRTNTWPELEELEVVLAELEVLDD